MACGSSYHAGMVAKYAIEHWARLPTEIDIASEFRYRDPVLDERTLVVGVSQSGETIDTLQAMREARAMGRQGPRRSRNVVDSSMAREADGVLYTHAGPEVGVAATKTHLAQIVALEILALYLAELRGTSAPADGRRLLGDMAQLPELIETVLGRADDVAEVAGHYIDARLLLPGPTRRLPGGHGGRAQAQGDLATCGPRAIPPASSSTAPSP